MNSHHPQALSGFALVNAIFLLLLMAALAALVANLATSQHASSAMDVQGSRAYQAARAGIEWGAYKILNPPAACFATTSFVPPAPTLSSFTVTVTCNTTVTSGVTVYSIQSTACNEPSAGSCPGVPGTAHYTERQIEVSL